MEPVFCAYCGKEIPEQVVKRRHYSPANQPATQCCNRDEDSAFRKQRGFYQQMSKAGKDARVEAVATSNRTHPRRKKRIG